MTLHEDRLQLPLGFALGRRDMPHAREHHAHQHAVTRTRERRHQLAHEAARLMAESGIRDYRLAKRKAAERLGIFDDASLPRNSEIDDALREYQRLFHSDTQPSQLQAQREAALRALEFFAPFSPRLVGPVLDGTADAHSPIMLHLYSDDALSVRGFLLDQGIPAQARGRRVRLDRNRHTDCDVWLFEADGFAFDVTVLPYEALRQAPLSPINEKPMPRASQVQLRELLTAQEILQHEADSAR